MRIYSKAEPGVMDLMKRVMQRNHQALWDAQINIAVTLVTKTVDPDDEVVPALKHRGVRAAAVIRLTRKDQRVHVEHDAEITIDSFYWDDASVASREALVDHELEHLVIARDKKNVIKTDDSGRIRLRLKPDDWTINGFRAVVQRNGIAAGEYQSARSVWTTVTTALADGINSSTTGPAIISHIDQIASAGVTEIQVEHATNTIDTQSSTVIPDGGRTAA